LAYNSIAYYNNQNPAERASFTRSELGRKSSLEFTHGLHVVTATKVVRKKVDEFTGLRLNGGGVA